MELYCFYTPSHAVLFEEWFRPSVPSEYNLHARYFDQQLCPSAVYREKGWRETQMQKVSYWIEAIEQNMGDVIVCSDVDAQFFGSSAEIVRSCMRHYDILFQWNCFYKHVVCSGFFVCRCNEAVLSFFTTVRNDLRNQLCDGEQDSINRILTSRQAHIRWGTLPRAQFWLPSMILGEHKKPFVPFMHIVYHHANWTRGVDSKRRQLQYVRDTVTRQRAYVSQCSSASRFRIVIIYRVRSIAHTCLFWPVMALRFSLQKRRKKPPR